MRRACQNVCHKCLAIWVCILLCLGGVPTAPAWAEDPEEPMTTSAIEAKGASTDIQGTSEKGPAEPADAASTYMSGTLSAMETELRAMTEETKEQQKYMNQFVEYTREISDSSTRYSNEMAEQLRILQEMDSKVSSEAKANMEEAFASLRETNREMRESTAAANAALARSAAEISDTMTRSAQSQVNGMLRSAGSVNTTLSDNTQSIVSATSNLNNQLVSSLNATLEAYDKSLMRIIGQLNATASRIENATNKVPQVVSDAYEGMQKSFDLMARETAAMVRSMDQLRRELRAQVSES